MTHAAFVKTRIVPLLLVLLTTLGGAALAPVLADDRRAPSRLPDLPPEGQFAVSRSLGRESPAYHAVAVNGGYRLDNRVQQLSATFDPADVTIQAGSVRWGFGLTSYGYGDERLGVVAVVPRAQANRVEYPHGALTEWYVNGPLGLQQGFTLATAPGSGEGEPLTLALTLRGGLEAELGHGGAGLTLRQPGGRAVLSYRGLTAFDAAGRRLRAWLELAPRTDEDRRAESAVLLVRVDDGGAQYPLVILPLIQQAKLTASKRAPWDVFGHSVAISGDTVVVGAPYDDFLRGSVYVFVKPGGGWATATETAKLTASDRAASDHFGTSVAISGDTVVVGAYGDDSNRGSAYVFGPI